MVRRLVQQQDVCIFQNEASQVHSRLFAARERIETPRAHIQRDGQTRAYLVQFGFRAVAAHAFKRSAQLAVAPQERRISVPAGHLSFQALEFRLHRVNTRKGALQHILHGISLRIHRNLGNKSQPPARRNHDLTAVIIHLIGQNFEQCALAAAVFAQQSHPFAGINFKRDPVQNLFFQVKGFDKP